ncbi:MAG: D-aminoacyl-tRNA deacylase [Fidelibacterota bacterium]
MIAVLQRVTSGSVIVNHQTIGEINHGLVILLGIMIDDKEQDSQFLTDKISVLRIFNDENDKMNLSIKDVNGSALVISQFTLCADTRKGRRPSFIQAAPPEKGEALYEDFMKRLESKNIPVQCGKFGAMMNVKIDNDGPVTIVLNSKE